MVVDASAESAIPWTAPWDLAFDVDNPRAGLDFDSPDGVHAVLIDSSVITIPADVSDADLVNLVRRNDGEVVGFLTNQVFSVGDANPWASNLYERHSRKGANLRDRVFAKGAV